MNYSPKKFYSSFKKAGWFLLYILILIREIIKANFLVFRTVWSFRPITPLLIRFKTALKSDAVKVLVANSITLTPGTFTVKIEDDTYFVHALDAPLSTCEECCDFFKYGAELEDKK